MLLLLAAMGLLWFATFVLVLAFASMLLAVFLQGLASLLTRYTHLPYKLSLAAVLLVLTGAGVGLGFLIGPNLAKQLDRLVQLIPSSLERLWATLRQYEWGRVLLDRASQAGDMDTGDFGPPVQSLLGRIPGIFSTVFNLVTGIVVVGVTGIYLAIRPRYYVEMLVRIVPPVRRERARTVVVTMVRTLRRWLVGRFVSMATIGVLTTIGLWILDIPLALSLGVLAGWLSFIPFLGPLLSVVPALLVALLHGVSSVLYVALLYAGVQMLESYLITPMVESRAVSLPPALIILVQVLMGTLLGLLGLLLATPFAVVVIVLIQMLYIEGVLGESVEPLGS